ncbi:hypothetical protein [Sphingomonas sp. 3-13AW]|uniref:hypothetical protein n=1 Tax=Sphingomonas sp. 3-13AW TaxID=3050450 RepID=UPI003BB55650
MRRITKVDVTRLTESCGRITYFVRLTTDEGFTLEPASFASHCVYDDLDGRQGLPISEARDRALTMAAHWADFMQIEVTPFYEDGVLYEPELPLEIYAAQREDRAA